VRAYSAAFDRMLPQEKLAMVGYKNESGGIRAHSKRFATSKR
jgi:hypothetical protein